ncbi:hypothetical protein BCR36DRAFT_583612 [Piromyces finnis]|uniref:Kinetochore protein NDC80 n=1 Tax=Piromyces finnis TaxID=1754191 RepID=A0A1Y1V9U6_9FUNG|nr:hypothetical protein BCR36DRAFT_583612 [Piromyces finnis]|eukprot:ORX50002.1 hypothetical protein BCR36DRAFT_583612 [Piromyces finnis]
MTITRRQTLSSFSQRQSPRHIQNRYSLMPNRNDNLNFIHGGMPSGMKRDKSLRQSINLYKTPNPNLSINDYARRSSSRLSTFGYAPSSLKKDIRPLRDKNWVLSAKKALIHFLVMTGFPDVSKTSLKSPSAKDFKRIFMFLYGLIDPFYIFSEKDFEDQVIQLIKGLRYPYADSISKSQLKSVGSTYAWPMILGILIWMVELIMSKDSLLQYIDMYAGKNESNGIFQMVSDIYKTFDENQYRQRIMEVSSNLETKTSEFNEESQKLDQEIEKLEKELEMLTTKESPLIGAKQANEQLLQDQNFLNIELKDIKQVEQQFVDLVNVLNEDFKVYEKQLVELSGEKENLNQEVIRRGISAIEIERSQAERDQLLSQQKSVDNQLEGKKKIVGEYEINLRKIIDEVETFAVDYNNRLTALGLSKYLMRNVEYQNKPFEIPLPICPTKTEELYASLNNNTMPFLVQLRKNFKEQCSSAHEMYIKLQSQYTRMKEIKTEQIEERDSKNKKIAHLNKKYENSRMEMKTELSAHNREIDNLDKRIQKLEREGESKFLEWKRKSSKAMMEYDELIRLYNELKEHISKEMLDLIQDVLRIKTTVHDGLLSLEQIATEALNEAHE